MNFEKFTTKLQEALAEAQSLAVGKDNPYIEPAHLLNEARRQLNCTAFYRIKHSANKTD